MNIKYVLWALGALHLAFGIYGLYAPGAVAGFIGFELQGAGAYSEMRAAYGGLIAAVGLGILRGSRGSSTGRQWLFAIALGYTGLFAGRVVSLAGDGASAHTLVSMAIEGAMAGFLLFAAGQLGSGTEARARPGDGAGRGEDVARPKGPDVGPGGPA